MQERALPFIVLGFGTVALGVTVLVTNVLLPHPNHNGHTLRRLCFTPDGKTLVGFGHYDSLDDDNPEWSIWDTSTGKRTVRTGERGVHEYGQTLSPDGTLAVVLREQRRRNDRSYGEDEVLPHELVAEELHTGKRRWIISVPAMTYDTPVFSPDGTQFCLVQNSQLLLYHTETGRVIKNLSFHGSSPRWLPDNKHFLVHLDKGALTQLALASTDGTITRTFGPPTSGLRWRLSKDGTKVVAALQGKNRLALYDVATGKEQASIPLPPTSQAARAYNSVAFSPSGAVVFSNDNKAVFLWDLTAKKLRPAKAPEERLAVLQQSKDGALAVQPDRHHDDGETSQRERHPLARLYDTKTGNETVTLEGWCGFP